MDQLRGPLVHNGLALDSDDRMLAAVLAGEISGSELAEAICSPRRMGLLSLPVAHWPLPPRSAATRGRTSASTAAGHDVRIISGVAPGEFL